MSAANGTTERKGEDLLFDSSKHPGVKVPPNPYFFPEFVLLTGLEFNGAPIFRFPVKDDPLTHVKNIRALQMREDDVMIAAYPKCGTHWVNEILHMLTSGSTEYSGRTKEYTMLEFVNDLSTLEKDPSPRLLNSHLYVAHLPEEMVEKKIKIIHIIRNPKDTAVSMYHHVKQSASSDKFTFENFLKGYTTENYLSLSHQFNYLRQMAEFQKAHPEHPIMNVHFEDLKTDSVPVIQEIAKLLGKPASKEFCQKVASACGFDKLKKADQSRLMPDNLRAAFAKVPTGRLSLYRKGIVGDWKNQFTVAQNEMFDEFISAQEKKSVGFSFRDY